MTPAGVHELVALGATVHVQSGAGAGSGFSDADYVDAGALLLPTIEAVYASAEMIVKVKEPIEAEYGLLKPGLTLFTYLHLAADEVLTRVLLEKRVNAFAYETLVKEGKLPLLEPMSEVAGKMAALMGAVHLGRYHGGEGLLMGGAAGTHRAKVMVLGGGTAGAAAARIAAGLGAEVTIYDINVERLRYLADVMPANVATLYSSPRTIADELPGCDVVVGTVLIPGAKAPKLITRDMLPMMKEGSVLVDVSIDQGGCFETSHPTTHSDPTFVESGVVHYCVANMPGAYPRTSTFALSNATLSYIKMLVRLGAEGVCKSSESMRSALNTWEGSLANAAVGAAHGIEVVTLPEC
jgi:alanine dehydrogenase